MFIIENFDRLVNELKKEVKWKAFPMTLYREQKMRLLGTIFPSQNSQWNKLENFIGTYLEIRETNLYLFIVELTVHNPNDLSIKKGYQLSTCYRRKNPFSSRNIFSSLS